MLGRKGLADFKVRFMQPGDGSGVNRKIWSSLDYAFSSGTGSLVWQTTSQDCENPFSDATGLATATGGRAVFRKWWAAQPCSGVEIDGDLMLFTAGSRLQRRPERIDSVWTGPDQYPAQREHYIIDYRPARPTSVEGPQRGFWKRVHAAWHSDGKGAVRLLRLNMVQQRGPSGRRLAGR
jgi:hypothetical protein